MNLRTGIISALMFLKARGQQVAEFETPVAKVEETRIEPEETNRSVFEERYLDLPSYVTQVKVTAIGFVTEPSGFPLPNDVVHIYQKLMSSASWFSPAVKHFSEEDWVTTICSEDPSVTFQRRVRKKELMFKILKLEI